MVGVVIRPAALLLCIAITGCATAAEPPATVAQRMVGQPLDRFIAAYGIPQTQQRLPDGRTVAEWADVYGVADVGSPVQALIASAGSAQVQGGSYQLVCKLRLFISKSGTIEQIAIATDTVGRYALSRCSEVLR